jgi:hypothetical protein
MIAIPAYSGTVHMATMRSLISDLILLLARGDKFTLVDDIGNALIADSRGVIATNFLKSECDQLIFIDSDVTWESGALVKLIDAPEDLVGGIYPQRADPLAWTVNYLDKPELWSDENGLIEVDAIPTGFMKISRNCVEKMCEAYPQQYKHDRAEGGMFYTLFEQVVQDDKRWGEDFSFCRRWRGIGGKVYMLPDIDMGHLGTKMFQGNLGTWLKSR